jgi:hypothetical protein
MHTVRPNCKEKTNPKVSTVDLLQAIKDLNERPDYGSKHGATLHPIMQLLSFRYPNEIIEFACFIKARDASLAAGLIVKNELRYFLTEAGEIRLQKETAMQSSNSSQNTNVNQEAIV